MQNYLQYIKINYTFCNKNDLKPESHNYTREIPVLFINAALHRFMIRKYFYKNFPCTIISYVLNSNIHQQRHRFLTSISLRPVASF